MFTNKEIAGYNKLIAEYMGWKPSVIEGEGGINLYYLPTDETGTYNYNCSQIDVAGMKYHTSWDRLMPVVEKIETIEFEVPPKYKRGALKNSTHANIVFDTNYDSREEFKGWWVVVDFDLGAYLYESGQMRFNTKIEAYWFGVVKFIEWYNKQEIYAKNK